MLNNATITKLREMKLSVMADAFAGQLEDNNFSEISSLDVSLNLQNRKKCVML